MAGKLKERLKTALCSRELDVGDVVRVPDARWDSLDHPIGGPGKWAVFIGGRGGKYVVRPMNPDGTTGKAFAAASVEHLDDVVKEAALKMYYASKGRKSA